MNWGTAPYLEQVADWPDSGRHILAAFDDESIVVYQAYRPEIGLYAAEHSRFQRGFSFTRMSWIKPNFLWMMYRSGWGEKPGQEVTLAISLRRSFFDDLLSKAVPSRFDSRVYESRDEWKAGVASSEVRLQWDPDHDPSGKPLIRRAIQLGLRGTALSGWDGRELLAVTDISDFVIEQRAHALSGDLARLRTPVEQVYPIDDPATRARLRIDSPDS